MTVLRLLFYHRFPLSFSKNVTNEVTSYGYFNVRCILRRCNLGMISNAAQEFSTSNQSLSDKPTHIRTVITEDGKVLTKKAVTSPKIRLIDLKGSLKTIYLNEAEKLAKRQGLLLVEKGTVDDKPTYELVESLESENLKKKDKKGIKIFIINVSSSSHDVKHKLDRIIKLLDKGHQIKVELHLKNSPKSDLENMANLVSKEIELKHKITERKTFKLGVSMTAVPNVKEDSEQTSEKTENV